MTVANTSHKNPNKSVYFSLLIGIHLAALPIYTSMPAAILLFILSLTFWQFYIIKKSIKNPGRIIQLILIGCACITILYSYGHFFGQQPGIALITLMTLLKLFETKVLRDFYIIIYSVFFITATNFFYSQSALLIFYVFFVIIFLVSILISLSDKLNTMSFKTRLKMASRFSIYAIPMMLILFILFPRIPGPLWGLPADAFSGQTGLSEEMAPGSIKNLISSSAIAFRVKFDSEIPNHNQRYWRGAVLSSYDGKTWRRKDASKKAQENIQYDVDTPSIRYTVTLEPNNLNWLLSLEYPQSYNQKYKLTREAMLVTTRKTNNVINYTIESQLSAANTALFPQESYKNRLLPADLNPQTISLAGKLVRQSNNDKTKYINNVLAHFRNNEFIYTLNPELLGTNAMDDFLFNSQKGFCEHYASAFTYLMRAAGIPSRVVIGYQGGKMNPLDDYMIVRQSDAHAWSEVWVDDQWQRIDPTAAVSPERVEQGIQNSGIETNQLPLLLLSNNNLLKNAAFLYDSFQNTWNQWVINFDQDKQNDLLKELGFEGEKISTLIFLMVIILTIAVLITTWYLLRQVSVDNDRTQHHFNLFCQKLQNHGVTRQLNEGPLDFETRIFGELSLAKQTQHDIKFILKSYRKLHYGNNINVKLLNSYITRIKSFTVRL